MMAKINTGRLKIKVNTPRKPGIDRLSTATILIHRGTASACTDRST